MKTMLATLTTIFVASTAQAAEIPVDLSTWGKDGTGNWVLSADRQSVTQTLNGDPVVFYSDYAAFGNRLSGTITVNDRGDDDFIGFVLGYNPGDLTSTSASYLLIDWKQTNQGGFFGCTSQAGLAISQVSGPIGDNAGAWCHNSANNVTELARGTTLSDTGWVSGQTYDFDLIYTDSLVEVYVDGALELSLTGSFSDGRFGFYNYSQANVLYAGITNEVLPPSTGAVPEPASWAMMIAGFGLAGAALRRRGARTVTRYATA